MANKRFTFADAKEKIKQLEAEVTDLRGILKDEFESATLDDSDNVYTTQEKSWIEFYKYFTWVTVGLGILFLVVKIIF